MGNTKTRQDSDHGVSDMRWGHRHAAVTGFETGILVPICHE